MVFALSSRRRLRSANSSPLYTGRVEVGVDKFRHGRVNYRMLYFFHEDVAAVVSHGIVKEQRVPSKEIDRAVTAKRSFGRNPNGHMHGEN